MKTSKATKFWKILAPEGPWREFQIMLEQKSDNMTFKGFSEYWSGQLGYSPSSIIHWMAGTRNIPEKAVKAMGITIDENHQSKMLPNVFSEISREARARQAAIERMCRTCALGDQFCRIKDCSLRPFSPLPLHPKATDFGSWEE